MKKLIPALAVSCAAVVAAAAGTVAASASSRPSVPPPVGVSAAANGKTVHAAPGATITITLSAHNDGGYVWSVSSAGGLKLESHRYVPPAGAPGAAGHDVFVFEVPTSGSHHLSLVDRRPWNGGGVASHFDLTVVG